MRAYIQAILLCRQYASGQLSQQDVWIYDAYATNGADRDIDGSAAAMELR